MITKESKRTDNITNEEKQKSDYVNFVNENRVSSNILMASGIIEIIFGVLAMFTAAFTGVAFAVLLGTIMVVGGIVEGIISIGRNNLARFFLGAITLIAGSLVIAHPLAGLNFLTLLIAGYMVVTGIIRLFGRDRQVWKRIGGAVGTILGIIIFATFQTISPVFIGLIVGINILIDGIITTRISLDIKQDISK